MIENNLIKSIEFVSFNSLVNLTFLSMNHNRIYFRTLICGSSKINHLSSKINHLSSKINYLSSKINYVVQN
jgi:outer membrane murein-binding lipoprotein Lpp